MSLLSLRKNHHVKITVWQKKAYQKISYKRFYFLPIAESSNVSDSENEFSSIVANVEG